MQFSTDVREELALAPVCPQATQLALQAMVRACSVVMGRCAQRSSWRCG